MSIETLFFLVTVILIFIVVYRNDSGERTYTYLLNQIGSIYDKILPYSYKVVKEKVKKLNQEYTTKQYAMQIVIFASAAAVISYMYFYNLVISVVYAFIAVGFIPYINYLRCKRLYSEFIFEQVQIYTTNVIMEFATTQSFVKALEGVYDSGVLEDPIKSDVRIMIDMAYENGTINQALDYMSSKYDYYIVKNMHQLFLQITNEGSKDAGESLENMSLDIDMLVESVYRDRMDRSNFHKKFIQFGLVLYGMVMLVQLLLGTEKYMTMIADWKMQLLIHLIVALNTYFLISGEKYYNEDVGAE